MKNELIRYGWVLFMESTVEELETLVKDCQRKPKDTPCIFQIYEADLKKYPGLRCAYKREGRCSMDNHED